MSTSAIEAKVTALRSARRYLILSILVAALSGIYEVFSHGVFSFFMLYAFAFPLVLGALPNLLWGMRDRLAPVPMKFRKLWGAGIATMTVGCLFRGALEIYGTDNALEQVYWILGPALLAWAGLAFLGDRRQIRRRKRYTLD